MTDPKEVADSLSEADQAAMRNARCEVPRSNDEWTASCACSLRYHPTLLVAGLAIPRERPPGGMILTQLGTAVRRELENRP